MKNVVVTLLLLLVSISSARGQTKKSLSALAVSPDDKTLVASGLNRTLYVCDADDLSVTKRFYLGVVSKELHFSKDGSTLVLLSDERTIHFYDTTTWKQKSEIKSAADIAIAADADLIAVMHGTVIRNRNRYTPVAFYDINSGEAKHEASFEFQGHSIGTNPDGTQVVLYSRIIKDETEPKEKAPNQLLGLEKEKFELSHDGRTCEVLWLDGALKKTQRNKTWYSEYGTGELAIKDNVATFVVYAKCCAMFKPTGETELFETGVPHSHGIRFSKDHLTLAAGSLASGAIMNLKTKGALTFKVSSLPGFPEHLDGFAFASDGTVYASSNAWRVFKISSDGVVVSVAPIF